MPRCRRSNRWWYISAEYLRPVSRTAGGGYRHVVHDFDSEGGCIGAGQHGAEEDGFEIATGVGFWIFDFCHDKMIDWLVKKVLKIGVIYLKFRMSSL